MNYQDYQQRVQQSRYNYGIGNWLVKQISQDSVLSNKQKVDLLSNASSLFSNRYQVRTTIRQGLYNIIDMLNRNSEVILTSEKLASYENLISQGLAYVGTRKVRGYMEDVELGTIEISKTVRYLKLSPLGIESANALAEKGRAIAKKELKRLERLRIA